MCDEIPDQEWSLALDRVAEELLWEAGVSEPPVDSFYIAGELGLAVTHDEQLAGRAHFVRVGGGIECASQPTIVLGDERRFERRQFAVAHELGEFAAVRVFEQLGVDPRSVPLGTRERVANSLAGRLLLPRRWFHKHAMAYEWDLLTLKDTFWTASHELIARRMLDMPTAVTVTVFDQGEMTWRRSNSRRLTGNLLEFEHDAWQQCHRSGLSIHGEAAIDGHTLTCSAWPVHEPAWRREIVRTETNTYD